VVKERDGDSFDDLELWLLIGIRAEVWRAEQG
jgi:hypothetical protein